MANGGSKEIMGVAVSLQMLQVYECFKGGGGGGTEKRPCLPADCCAMMLVSIISVVKFTPVSGMFWRSFPFPQ